MENQPLITVGAMPNRQARLARIGLLGIAAAAFVAVALLAFGAGAAPGGILAANDTTNSTDQIVLGHGGPGGRFGFGGGITITSISGSSISLKTVDGWTRTITVDSGTTYSKSGTTIKLSDLQVGDQIRFQQTRESDGSYTINAIEVVLPHVGGTVTAVDASTITLLQPDGATVRVTVTSSTTYRVNGDTGSLSDVKAGMVLIAQGTKNADGSLTATEIRAGAIGMGGHRGRGMGPGMGPGIGPFWDNDGPNASAAPQATGSAS